jgi:hypothetical protein
VEVLLDLAQTGVNAYETVLTRLVGPASLRGMVTSCLADLRLHRRALEDHVERRHCETRQRVEEPEEG